MKGCSGFYYFFPCFSDSDVRHFCPFGNRSENLEFILKGKSGPGFLEGKRNKISQQKQKGSYVELR